MLVFRGVNEGWTSDDGNFDTKKNTPKNCLKVGNLPKLLGRYIPKKKGAMAVFSGSQQKIRVHMVFHELNFLIPRFFLVGKMWSCITNLMGT